MPSIYMRIIFVLFVMIGNASIDVRAQSADQLTGTCHMTGLSKQLYSAKLINATMDSEGGIPCSMIFGMITMIRVMNLSDPSKNEKIIIDSADVIGKPNHGTVTTNDGYVTYTPDISYNGPDKFSVLFTGSDNGKAAKSTVRFAVSVSH